MRFVGIRQIEKWKSERGVYLSARSWNIEAETLKQIFAYAKDELRFLIENPIDSLKRKNPVVIPTKEQFSALVAELRAAHNSTGEAADFVELLGYSGCRKQKACSIERQDVNFELSSLRITGGELGAKNHESRLIPLFKPLRRLIESILDRKPSHVGPLIGIRDARLQIHRACERLGLPSYGHHTMRHFFCSNAIEAGIDFDVTSLFGSVG